MIIMPLDRVLGRDSFFFLENIEDAQLMEDRCD